MTQKIDYMPLIKESFSDLANDIEGKGNTWTVNSTSGNVTVKQAKKSGRGSDAYSYLAYGEFPMDASFVFKTITDFATVNRWCSIASTQVVEEIRHQEIPHDIYIQKHAPSLGGMISPRDFILFRAWKEEEGSLWQVARSVSDKIYPPVNGFVRGTLHMSGLCTKPLPTNPNHCTLYYEVHSSIGGYLPSWAVNKGIVGEMTAAFAKILELLLENQSK